MLEVIRLKSHPCSLPLSPPTNPNPLETLPSWVSNAADGNPAQTAICVVARTQHWFLVFIWEKGWNPIKEIGTFQKIKTWTWIWIQIWIWMDFAGFYFLFLTICTIFFVIYIHIYILLMMMGYIFNYIFTMYRSFFRSYLTLKQE